VPGAIGEVTKVLLAGNSGPGNLCRLVTTFYFVNASTTIDQVGLQVTLNPNDIKYSFDVTGCTSLQSAMLTPAYEASWDPRNVTVVGRTAGPSIKVFGSTVNPFAFIKSFDAADPVNSTDILLKWDSICTSNATGFGSLIEAPPGFNFSREVAFVLEDSKAGYDYTFAIRFLRWAYSDGRSYTIPGLPFDVTGIFQPTPIGNGTFAWSLQFGVRAQFHFNVSYDPSLTLNTLFDLSAGEPPTESSASPSELALQTGVNVSLIVGVTVAAVAVVAIVAVLFLVRPIRRKILPYSGTRVRTASLTYQNPLPDEDNPPAVANSATKSGSFPPAETDPQSVQSPRWSTANTRDSLITNT
jgi:hypothetical protein